MTVTRRRASALRKELSAPRTLWGRRQARAVCRARARPPLPPGCRRISLFSQEAGSSVGVVGGLADPTAKGNARVRNGPATAGRARVSTAHTQLRGGNAHAPTREPGHSWAVNARARGTAQCSQNLLPAISKEEEREGNERWHGVLLCPMRTAGPVPAELRAAGALRTSGLQYQGTLPAINRPCWREKCRKRSVCF